jgi:hypothetical protein
MGTTQDKTGWRFAFFFWGGVRITNAVITVYTMYVYLDCFCYVVLDGRRRGEGVVGSG